MGLLVEPGVLDGHASLGGEDLEGPLVLGGEFGAAGLLRQVDVAEHPMAGGDGRTEERVHLGVVRREADGPRIRGDLPETQGQRLVDQHPKDAPTDRGVADRVALLVGHAAGDELGDQVTPGTDDPQRAVAGAGDLRRQLDDPLEQGGQRQLGGQSQPGLQQHVPAFQLRCHAFGA